MLKKINSFSIQETNTCCTKYNGIHDFRQMVNTKQGALMICERCKSELFLNKFMGVQDNDTASSLNPFYLLPPEVFARERELSNSSCRL